MSRIMLAIALAVSVDLCNAGILTNPPQIVERGDFITDTERGLDWYKFGSSQTTVERSYNDVFASGSLFVAGGWRIASIHDIHSLWRNFGWEADSEFAGTNANQGLADALISYLVR